MIKIDFEFTTEYGAYKDALSLPDDHTFSEEDIENLKQERLSNWLTIINTPIEVENKEYIEIEGVKYVKAEG